MTIVFMIAGAIRMYQFVVVSANCPRNGIKLKKVLLKFILQSRSKIADMKY